MPLRTSNSIERHAYQLELEARSKAQKLSDDVLIGNFVEAALGDCVELEVSEPTADMVKGGRMVAEMLLRGALHSPVSSALDLDEIRSAFVIDQTHVEFLKRVIETSFEQRTTIRGLDWPSRKGEEG